MKKKENVMQESCMKKNDAVDHPAHYTQGGIECIDAIKASSPQMVFWGFLRGNCQKYLWRCFDKGKLLEDLRKARWYLDRLIREVEEAK